MATVKVFEDLEIWKMARAQCDHFFHLARAGRFSADGVLADQMNRSSGSVMDNIAEGFDRFSKPDFRRFLLIARGSNAEFRSQCYRAQDRQYLAPDEAGQVIETARHLGIRINKLILRLSEAIAREGPSRPPSKPINGVKEPEMVYSSKQSHPYDDILD